MYEDKVLNLFYLYGFMIAVGMLLALFLLHTYCHKRHYSARFIDFIETTGIFAIMGGFAGAWLFQKVYNFNSLPNTMNFWARVKEAVNMGGITFLGGLIGGAATFLIIYFIRRKHYTERISDILSVAPGAICIAHGFGRIGCFFAGCCYGRPVDAGWEWLGQTYPSNSSTAYEIMRTYGSNAAVYPTQLLESGFLFLLGIILLFLAFKKNYKYTFPIYMMGYGVFRFLNEFLRGDSGRGVLFDGKLSPSQYVSILLVVCGIAAIFFFKYFIHVQSMKEVREIDKDYWEHYVPQPKRTFIEWLIGKTPSASTTNTSVKDVQNVEKDNTKNEETLKDQKEDSSTTK